MCAWRSPATGGDLVLIRRQKTLYVNAPCAMFPATWQPGARPRYYDRTPTVVTHPQGSPPTLNYAGSSKEGQIGEHGAQVDTRLRLRFTGCRRRSRVEPPRSHFFLRLCHVWRSPERCSKLESGSTAFAAFPALRQAASIQSGTVLVRPFS